VQAVGSPGAADEVDGGFEGQLGAEEGGAAEFKGVELGGSERVGWRG